MRGRVFACRGGGQLVQPPKTGGGVGKRAQVTGPLIGYYELWPKIFLNIQNGQCFCTKYMANDD